MFLRCSYYFAKSGGYSHELLKDRLSNAISRNVLKDGPTVKYHSRSIHMWYLEEMLKDLHFK